MNRNFALARLAQGVALLVVGSLLPIQALSAEGQASKTNWVPRSITNEIEIRMPLNVFVNEYHTNWIEHWATNLVAIYRTNRLTLNLTNQVTVDAVRTNYQDAYKTNWETLILTNEIAVRATHTNFTDVYKTNWNTVTLPKEVAVEAIRTNFVDRYRTNVRTLNLTNWETVLVMKTNWIAQKVTNMVELDLPDNRFQSKSKAAPEDKETRVDSTLAQPVVGSEVVELEASRTARAPVNNQFEVELKLKPSRTPMVVQRWRVERTDGAVLLFGQEQEFKHDLSIGKYKVEARVQGEAGTLPFTTRGILEVTATQAAIQQKLLGKK
jgi:hypothetical protein